MKQLYEWIKIIVVFGLFCLAFYVGYVGGRQAWRFEQPEPKVVVLLPNQGQLQQILNAIEPDTPIEVDYVVGKDSREKWDRIVHNEYASVYMTPTGAPKGE